MKSNKQKHQSEKLLNVMQEMDKQSSEDFSIRDRIHKFYVCEMYKILKTFKRGPILATLVVVIYFSQVISNQFNQNILANLISGSKQSEQFIYYMGVYLDYVKIYPLYSFLAQKNQMIDEKESNGQFLIIVGVFNSALLMYIFIRLIHYIFWQYFTDISMSSQDSTEKLARNYTSHSFLVLQGDILFSFFFRIYLYTLTIPFIQISLKVGIEHSNEQHNPNENQSGHQLTLFLVAYAFITTFFISGIISNNEYDYQIIIKDHLSQPKNYYVYLRIILDFICSGVFLSSSTTIVEIFNIINCSLRLVICIYRQPFYSQSTNKIFIQFILFHIFLLIITLILDQNSRENLSISFTLLFCCGVPLCIKSGILIINLLKTQSQFNLPFIENDINNISPEKLDKHIRSLINLFSLSYEDYMDKGRGIKFETIFSNHLDSCCKTNEPQQIKVSKNAITNKDENICFCKQYQEFVSQKNYLGASIKLQQQLTFSKDEVNQAISRVIGQDYRKSFLIKYTSNLIQKFFKSSNKNYQDSQLQIKPTYLYFLCQIAQTPAKAFQQILLLKQQMKQSSFQTQCLIQEIIDDINLSFSQFICSTTYQNQRLAISYVYEFDYFYKDFIQSFKKALQSRQRYFEFLCTDYINLQELLKESYSCLATKREAEYKMNNLFDIHPHHPRLLSISELYIEFFDFRKRRVRHFIQKSKELMNRNLQRVDLKVNLFEQGTCSIFVSLHSKQIIKVSNSIQSFFKCQKQDLIGKQFSILLPDFIISSFNKYLDILLEEGNMDMIKLGEYLTFFSIPNTNTLQPIYLRMKIDVLSNSEFGLSIQIQPAKNCKVSVITDLNYNIMSFTKEFQNLILKFLVNKGTTKSKNQDQLKGLNIQAIIPLLFSINKITQDFNNFEGYNDTFGFKDQKIQNYTTYKTLLVLPKTIKCLKSLNSFSKNTHKDVQNYFNSLNLQEIEMLEITFSPFSYKLYSQAQQTITVIEFQSYRKLKAISEINDQFLRLKETLTSYYQQEINVPIAQTNSPKIDSQYEVGTLSYLNIQNEKKQRLQVKNKLEMQDSDGVYSVEVENKNIQYSSQAQLDFYQDDIIQRHYENHNSADVDVDSPVLQESPHYQPTDYLNYIYDKVTPQKRNNDSQQDIFINTENHNEIGMRYMTMLKVSKDTKSTRIEESQQATTSRQSLISPRQPYEPIHNQNQSQDDLFKALSANPISSPLMQSSQSFVHLFEKQFSTPNRKESDTQTKEKKQDAKQDGSSTNDGSHLNINNSLIELQRQRSKFFSKNKIQAYSQNLLQVNQKSSANFTSKISQISQNSEKREKEEEEDEEEDEGVIQLSIMPSKEAAKQGQKSNMKGQKSGLFQDEESQNANANKKKGIMDDQQSVRSGQSQIFSKKQSLYEMISSRRDTTEIQVSRFVGLSAFIILITISCVLFVKVKQNFQDEWTSYTNLQVGPNLLEGFAQILRVKELLTIIEVNKLYGYLFSSFKPTDQLKYYNEGLDKLSFITKEIGSFQITTIHDGFEDFMLNNYTSLVQVNSVTLVQNIINFSRLYSLLNLPLNLRKYLIESVQDARSYVYYNYASFIGTIKNIQDISTSKSKSTLDETQSLLNMSIIVVQAVCVLTVLIVFPVYYIIQQKREEILCLLVTFDMQFLQSQIEKYKQALYEKKITESISNLSKFERYATKTKAASSVQQISVFDFSKPNKQTKNKKRQISQTRPLPKYSIKLSIITLIIFIVISLYSLLNYLLTKDFFSYFVYNIQELSLITQSKSYLDLNYCGLFLLTNSYAYQFNMTTIGLIYQFFNSTVFPDNQERINSFYGIDNGFINSRYNSDLYQKYFLDIIKTNACSILNTTYGQPFVINNTMIDINQCEKIQKGVLGNGLTFSFKQIFGLVQSYFTNFKLTAGNALKFFGSLKQWDYDNNLKEFDYVYYYIRAILGSLVSFLVEQSQEYFDYLMGVQEALFIYNLIVVFLVFVFAWTRFLQEMSQQIQETTFLLSLIPVEQLLDNPYIVSYINKVKNTIRRSQ